MRVDNQQKPSDRGVTSLEEITPITDSQSMLQNEKLATIKLEQKKNLDYFSKQIHRSMKKREKYDNLKEKLQQQLQAKFVLDQSTVGDSNYGSTYTFLESKATSKEFGNRRMIHTSFPGKRFIK